MVLLFLIAGCLILLFNGHKILLSFRFECKPKRFFHIKLRNKRKKKTIERYLVLLTVPSSQSRINFAEVTDSL